MTTKSSELLTPEEAVAVLYGTVTAQAIRKRVRKGMLRSYQKPGLAGRIFVKKSELLKLYRAKIERVRPFLGSAQRQR